MYWLTPFHYLLEGLLGVVTHKRPVRCLAREEARFRLPPGFGRCQEYAGLFVRQVGGYVRDVGNGMCAFCQFANGNQFVGLAPFLFCFLLIYIGGANCLLSTYLHTTYRQPLSTSSTPINGVTT